MPLPGRCVSAGALVLNYGATNVAPTQRDRHLLSSAKHINGLEQKFGHGSRQGPKPRSTVLARASSNLLDLDLCPRIITWNRIGKKLKLNLVTVRRCYQFRAPANLPHFPLAGPVAGLGVISLQESIPIVKPVTSHFTDGVKRLNIKRAVCHLKVAAGDRYRAVSHSPDSPVSLSSPFSIPDGSPHVLFM
jgi:hypothetical protein